MSFDQFKIPKGAASPDDGSPTEPTAEFGATAGIGETPAEGSPVSFIRESWLLPPARIPAGGTGTGMPGNDTDPLPVIIANGSKGIDSRGRQVVRAVGVLLIGLIAGLGYLSVHNSQLAAKWQHRDAAQVALTQKVSAQLQKANNHITTLDSTVGSLQGQLSTVAKKQKADSGVSGVLHRLLWPFG